MTNNRHIINLPTIASIVARYEAYCDNSVFTSRREVNRRLISEYNFQLWEAFFTTLLSYVIFTHMASEDLDTTDGALLDALDVAMTSQTQFSIGNATIVDACNAWGYLIDITENYITVGYFNTEPETLSNIYLDACKKIIENN